MWSAVGFWVISVHLGQDSCGAEAARGKGLPREPTDTRRLGLADGEVLTATSLS